MANETRDQAQRQAASGNSQRDGDADAPKLKPPGYYEGETMTRRMVFSGGAMALGGIMTAAIGLPAIGFAVGPLFEEHEQDYQDVGPPSDFTSDNYLPKTITIAAGVGEAGKTTVYVREGNPVFKGERSGEYIAISTRCAHLGCPVRWVVAAERFVCPCHGGVYDFEGKVAGGPPVRPLDRFVTRVKGGQVQVGPRYSVNSQLKRFSPRDPGEKLDGLWQYLWPKRPSVPSPS
jgi:quinol---cytochrome c reductase iron-sulfur subunit, bacillus type